MALYYNDLGYEEANELVTFSDIPNILNLKDDEYGTKAKWDLTLSGNISASADSQYYITFLGDTITNVTTPELAVSKYFYISSANTSTVASIARAMRNLAVVAANFNVTHSADTVTLTAKKAGPILPNDPVSTNIGNLSSSGINGTSTSYYYNSKIDVDVYADDAYVTTLEKNFYNGSCSFNMSPVLTSISEIGKATPYHFVLSTINDAGDYEYLARVPQSADTYNYTTVGYMVNQGSKYLYNDGTIAQNYSRGESRSGEGISNNTILYVYNESFPMTIYRGDAGGGSFTVRYLDSAYQEITAQTVNWSTGGTSDIMYTIEVPINKQYLSSSVYYIDVDGLEGQRIRYNVIKPLQMTEGNQRLYFRNSYGGISFVEMTGAKQLTKDIETTTFEKNIYDYYTSDVNSLEKPYDIKIKDTYTLKSHLFEKDGKYIYHDLAQSPYVWTIINGETYQVLIDSISVDEVSNNNDIYQSTVKLHLSQPTSLL